MTSAHKRRIGYTSPSAQTSVRGPRVSISGGLRPKLIGPGQPVFHRSSAEEFAPFLNTSVRTCRADEHRVRKKGNGGNSCGPPILGRESGGLKFPRIRTAYF